jgi:GTP-binding protein HflX
MVFNKTDQLNGNQSLLSGLLDKHPNGVAISAATGEGMPALLGELSSQLRPVREFLELSVPQEQAGVIARLHEVAQVVERRYEGDRAHFKARIPPHLHNEFAPFFVRDLQSSSA